jgi:hypothetical protein
LEILFHVVLHFQIKLVICTDDMWDVKESGNLLFTDALSAIWLVMNLLETVSL